MTVFAIYLTGFLVTFIFTMADYLADVPKTKRNELVAITVSALLWPINVVYATGEILKQRGKG